MTGMADVNTRSRQSAGQPTGGQFAAEAHSTDTGVSLGVTEEVEPDEFDRRVDDMLRQFCEDPEGLSADEQRQIGERALLANAIRIASTWRERNKRQTFTGITESDIAQEAVTEMVEMARAGRLGALTHPKSYLGKVVVKQSFELRASESTLSRKGELARTKFMQAVAKREAQQQRSLTHAERREVAEQIRAEDRAKKLSNVPSTDEWWQQSDSTAASWEAMSDIDGNENAEGAFNFKPALPAGTDHTDDGDELLDLAEDVGRMDARDRKRSAYPIMAHALGLPSPVGRAIPRERLARTRSSVADAGGARAVARRWTAGQSGSDVDAFFAPFGKDLSLADRDRIAGFVASHDDETANGLWDSAMVCVRHPQYMEGIGDDTRDGGVSQ